MNIHKFFLCHILIYATSLRPITSSCLFNGEHTLDKRCTGLVVNSLHSTVKYALFNFDNLSSLTIDSNKVNAPPNLPSKMKTNLQNFNFLYCGLTSLQKDYFNGFTNLIYLSIVACDLTAVPSLPNFLKAQLVHFDISRNLISDIPPNYFTNFTNLTELDLRRSQFSKFSFGNSIKLLLQLKSLHLDQMKCDCTAIEMWMDVRSRLTNFKLNIYNIYRKLGPFPCSKPLEKISLQQLNESLTCSPGAGNVTKYPVDRSTTIGPELGNITTAPDAGNITTAPDAGNFTTVSDAGNTTTSPDAEMTTNMQTTGSTTTSYSVKQCSQDASLCVHGVCTKKHNTVQYNSNFMPQDNETVQHECSCHKGWTGVYCAEDVNECTDVGGGVQLHQCSRKSTCRNRNGSYTCDCHEGRTGKYCNEEPNFMCYYCAFRNYDCDLKVKGTILLKGMIQERSCPGRICSTVHKLGRTYFRCGDRSFCRTPNVSCCVKPLCNEPVIREQLQRTSSSRRTTEATGASGFLYRYDIVLLLSLNLL